MRNALAIARYWNFIFVVVCSKSKFSFGFVGVCEVAVEFSLCLWFIVWRARMLV